MVAAGGGVDPGPGVRVLLDGDGEIEIVTATVGGDLFAMHLDGSFYHHFPITGSIPFRGSPAIQDLEGDGDLEILIGGSLGLHIIDIKEDSSHDESWNMHRGGLERTGYFQSTHSVLVHHSEVWNLVGLPMDVENSDYLELFPDAVQGTLYSFDYNYVNELSLNVGTGYWLRFNEEGSDIIAGVPFYSLALFLEENWNLISGITNTISIDNIIIVVFFTSISLDFIWVQFIEASIIKTLK